METSYSDEKNVQILIALLKFHGIRKVIASPGTTNIAFVKSLQSDPFFEMYSAVDERSAAYMACGMAAETGEAVVINCTGATASRNYYPGLTEAYYRKLPVLAVTSSQSSARIGHLVAQVTDRNSGFPADVLKASYLMPIIKDQADWEAGEITANKTFFDLFKAGGGPVHINLETTYSNRFDVAELPAVRQIEHYKNRVADFPTLPAGKIGVFVGSHGTMSPDFIRQLEAFCATNNAVVFTDHTSAYKGKYAVLHALASAQRFTDDESMRPDLTIHIGEISGDYFVDRIIGKEVWRVSEDGAIRDTFNNLTKVFEMTETAFFAHYTKEEVPVEKSYLELCQRKLATVQNNIPELPFSNIWVAEQLHDQLPENATLYLGILNSLRSWNFFELHESITTRSNVGGFGIDGNVSALLGAALARPDKLCFGVIGDLAFFYDMNTLGNRHVSANMRILLINNGLGMEFKNFGHQAYQYGSTANSFTAAEGHFGQKSTTLVRDYAQSLGFEYLTAANKEDFEEVYARFMTDTHLEKPIIFEVFTNELDESNALEQITAIEFSDRYRRKENIKNLLGKNNIKRIRRVLKS